MFGSRYIAETARILRNVITAGVCKRVLRSVLQIALCYNTFSSKKRKSEPATEKTSTRADQRARRARE